MSGQGDHDCFALRILPRSIRIWHTLRSGNGGDLCGWVVLDIAAQSAPLEENRQNGNDIVCRFALELHEGLVADFHYACLRKPDQWRVFNCLKIVEDTLIVGTGTRRLADFTVDEVGAGTIFLDQHAKRAGLRRLLCMKLVEAMHLHVKSETIDLEFLAIDLLACFAVIGA